VLPRSLAGFALSFGYGKHYQLALKEDNNVKMSQRAALDD
jgi:hypothetical protein